MVINLLAGVAQSVDLGSEFGYVKIRQDKGTEPVYANTKTATVGQVGALVISPFETEGFRFDAVQTLSLICAADATVVVDAVKEWPGARRRTLTPDTVETFDFPAKCRTFEIVNLDESTDAYYALDRDPDSAEEWTRKLPAYTSYSPVNGAECNSIRVISTAAVEIEVEGYPMEDPFKRDHNTRR